MRVVNYNLDGSPIEESTAPVSQTDDGVSGDEVVEPIESTEEAVEKAEEEQSVEEDLIPEDINDVEPVEEATVIETRLGLEQCRDDILWLCAMHRTIGLEGICKQDMRSLRLIQHRIEGSEGLKFGNEAYGDAMFFDDRSELNKARGLESFARTIAKTVMDWIKRLIQYLGQLYQWAKTTIVGETRYKIGFERRLKRYELARKYRAQLEARTKTQFATNDIMTNYARQLLSDERVLNNNLTAASMGSHRDYINLQKHFRDVDVAVKSFLKELVKFKEGIQKSTPEINVIERDMLKITLVTDTLEKYLMESPTPVEKVFDASSFESGIPKLTQEILPMDYLMDACYEAQKIVKQIRRIDDQQNMNVIVALLNGAMQATTNIGTVINIAKRYNDTRLQVIELFVNYEDKYIAEIQKAVKNEVNDTSLADFVKRTIEEARAEIGKI